MLMNFSRLIIPISEQYLSCDEMQILEQIEELEQEDNYALHEQSVL